MRPWTCLLSLVLLHSAAPAYSGDIPEFRSVKESYIPSDAALLDRRGEPIAELRVINTRRSFAWTTLSEISPAMIAAIIEFEDRRFRSHDGVDWAAMAGATWQSVTSLRIRGGSTITMQLVSLLGLQRKTGLRRSILEKRKQIQLAIELERNWTKDEILEAYLNLVSFRGEIVGIRAASFAFFNKGPIGLNEHDSAFLAATLRSPNGQVAVIANTICAVRREKSCVDWMSHVSGYVRKINRRNPQRSQASHLAGRLLPTINKAVRTTLDGAAQSRAVALVEEQVTMHLEQKLRDAAVLAVENSTGNVLVYVGGSGRFSSAVFVDGVRAKRQAGSTLKPFLYGLAWERNLLGLNSPIVDEAFEETHENGSYRPENYDRRFHGLVNAQVALASSLNVPAVKVINLVGVSEFLETLENFGFTDLAGADTYGSSLALGSADVTLWDLVNAYRSLANEGIFSPLRLKMDDPKNSISHRALTARASQMVTHAISSGENRVLGFGWDNILATRYPSAAKTGTSKDMRDNWCIGFSKDYTVGVWVGNFGGEPMRRVSGLTGAGPIWRGLMDFLHQDVSVKGFPKVDMSATEHLVHSPVFGKIKQPADGAIFAFDPDFPKKQQAIPLESELDGIAVFKLNGRILPKGTSQLPLVRGFHELILSDERGKTLDRVRYEVR